MTLIHKLLIGMLCLSVSISSQEKMEREFSRDDLSISYYSNMVLEDSGQDGTVLILATQKDGEDDIFIENINLVVKEVDITFKELVEATSRDVKNTTGVVENRVIKVNGEDCQRLKFSLNQDNYELTFLQHYIIKNNKVYLLTFSSETEKFDKYYEEFNDVLMSFKLK